MKRRSVLKAFWALAAVVSLAFSQVVLAAFTCPMPTAQMASAMAEGDGCLGADPGAMQLCEKSCQGEPQKYDAPSAPALPPAPEIALRVEPSPPPVIASGATQDALLARATSPPASILFARFLK